MQKLPLVLGITGVVVAVLALIFGFMAFPMILKNKIGEVNFKGLEIRKWLGIMTEFKLIGCLLIHFKAKQASKWNGQVAVFCKRY